MKKLGLILILVLCIGILPIQAKIHAQNTPPTPEIDWPEFWVLFRQYAAWGLEWYDGTEWVQANQDLEIIREHPEPHKSKLTLVFDATHAGDYRLTFAIDKKARNYVTRLDKYQYSIDYNELSLTFDWSDAAAIPGIIFNHGVNDDVFWFRMKRNSVPLGAHVEIDPVIIIDSYIQGVAWEPLDIVHPSDTAGRISAAGQTFNSSEKFRIVNATFRLMKTGNPQGIAHGVLYQLNNTAGVNATPIGGALATSDDFDISSLGAAFAYFNLSFTGGDQYVCQSNTSYGIVFQIDSATTLDGANYVRVNYDDAVLTHSGNFFNYDNNSWVAFSNRDLKFRVYGDSYWNELADSINQAFQYFGVIGDYITQISILITGLTTYFTDSLNRILAIVIQQFRVIDAVYGWVVYWTTAMIGIVLQFSEFYHQLLDGTSVWSEALSPWWNLVVTGIAIAPLVFFIAWLDSIVMRELRTGQDGLSIFIGDLGTAVNIISYLFSMFTFVANTIIDRVYGLIDAM